MKTFVALIILLVLASASVTFAADTGLNPSKVEAKIYGVYLSTSELCTGAIETASTASPSYSDFLSGPTLVDADNSTGALNGTYKCVIIKMSDKIRVTPTSTSDSGNCVAGTAFETDICSVHGTGPGSAQQSQDIPGVVSDCTNGEEVVYLYLSRGTSASSEGHNTFLAPTTGDVNKGVNLGADLVINGAAASEFVINATGQVGDQGGECGMERPTFSFR